MNYEKKDMNDFIRGLDDLVNYHNKNLHKGQYFFLCDLLDFLKQNIEKEDFNESTEVNKAKKLLRENGFYVFKKAKKLNEARVKVLDRKVGESLGIEDYPNFHKSGSVRGMKDRFYGKDALLVRCGDYIYNVSRNPEIYELAESTKLNENHRDEDWGILIDFLDDIDAQYKYDREEKNAINIYGTNGWHSVCYNEKNRTFSDIHDIFATDDQNDSIKEFKDPYDLIDYIREYA